MSTKNPTSASPLPLSVSGLKKNYGTFSVLRGLDLELEHEAIHGLVGLNGSGKTTSLECILGLQEFNGGQVHVLGRSPNELHAARGKIVAVFDTPSLHPNLSLMQCLHQAALLCETVYRTPLQVAQMLGIERYSNFKIKQLSLGNKRRASIAQALLGRPELIVLDEPFNGLDAEGVDDVLQLITTLNREEGTAFLLASHQLPYLEQVCSHIAILHHGRIVVSDEIAKLLGQSKSTILLKSAQPESAAQFIQQLDGFERPKLDAEGYLRVDGETISSANLNQKLVAAGIDVSELIVKRGSLASLFREITSEKNDSGSDS